MVWRSSKALLSNPITSHLCYNLFLFKEVYYFPNKLFLTRTITILQRGTPVTVFNTSSIKVSIERFNSQSVRNEMSEMNDAQKNRKSSTCASVRSYFREYCESTSIHGFKYLGETENRPICERLWWVIVFIFCLSGCSFMIYNIYKKWDKSPVIVTFATKETAIYEIPFPAVTICPETKSDKSKFDFAAAVKRRKQATTNTKEKKILDYVSFFCDDFTASDNNLPLGPDFLEIIDEVKPNFLDHVHNCSFMGKKLNCRDSFTPVFTDEGICYSFNILDRSQIFSDSVVHFKNYHRTGENNTTWSFEKGYLNKSKFDVYPRRALLAGASNGLSLQLTTPKNDIDYECKAVQGYRVLLHTPMRMPRLKEEFFRVPLDEAVVVSVQPTMIGTSEAVKTYNIAKRDCCFPSERKLKFFRDYSQLNCQLECLTNFTLDLCGCVSIFMPRERETAVCGTSKFECLKEAERTLQTEGLYDKFQEGGVQGGTDCDCMPLCTDLSYNTQISQTSWEKRNEFGKSSTYLSSLTVYFKFNHFITSERNELYGPTDFLANFGGLLGLFTGFSILSLMEIIYFLTLRICCNIKMYNRWTGINKQ
nr:PREDICTED: pickpocket protein 28 isoform X1 [Tribolium castaneum]|eukprot:XP_015833861.1 PREDICTED: pickpocket protein 28 isoform X1 [Tribolium castaneum]